MPAERIHIMGGQRRVADRLSATGVVTVGVVGLGDWGPNLLRVLADMAGLQVAWILDLAPHDFSILLYWFGEMPEVIRAVGRDSIVNGIPDVAFITMKLPSGVLANVELSWLAPSKLRRTAVVGSKKMVVYDDTSTEPIRVFDSGVDYQDPETFGEYQLSYRTGDILSPRLETFEPLAAELSDFTSSVRDGNSVT